MMSLYLFVFTLALAASVLAKELTKFNDQYTINGTLNIPLAEIKEPFTAWYDGRTQLSRIDYYGGMVKTYQLRNQGKYGSSLRIFPITNKSVLNKKVCWKLDGTNKSIVHIQPVLPDTKKFEFVESETIRGRVCDKWRSKYVNKKNLNKMRYTLWVYENSELRQTIPVRYEKQQCIHLLGSCNIKYYFDYDSYSMEKIPNAVFKISSDMECKNKDQDLLGNNRYLYFNPMQEFVQPTNDVHFDLEFGIFKEKHGIQYMNETEHEFRKNIFRQNLHFINSKNRANLGYSLAINHLADRTEDELKARLGLISSGVNDTGKPFPYDTQTVNQKLPEEFDWRQHGAVTPVKEQSVCGSCWSFAATGAVEGALFLKTRNLVRLSQQALIDCSWGFGNNGCDGGHVVKAYNWIRENGGIPTEEDYGNYLAQDGFCHVNNVTKVANISGYVSVTSNDPNAFKLALVNHGQLSVGIDASLKTFFFYSSGIYDDSECKNQVKDLNHAVLAVGYGKIKGKDYWLVKNSWSSYWGNKGYIMISTKNNNCGVMTKPRYVEIE